MEINNLKFIRNILICVLAFGIVAFILNMAPGFKRDKFTDITNIILADENITEQLKNLIYVNENNTVYLSIDDVRNIFNSNIYYEEDNRDIITIHENNVSRLSLDEKNMEINGVKTIILDAPIEKEGIIYLPVSEMTNIFNIEMQYAKEEDNVIIDSLEKGIIKADIAENTEIKFKPRSMSKVVGQVKTGENVSCFYTTSKGWRLIRTEKGILRICKSKYFR